jgi:hypothetical protein
LASRAPGAMIVGVKLANLEWLAWQFDIINHLLGMSASAERSRLGYFPSLTFPPPPS